MYYIIFDLEFNQDFSSLQIDNIKKTKFPFEIIQIGALKLDMELNTIDTFNRFIKPTIYKKISPFITELTGITTEQLQYEETFTEVFDSYTEFISGTDSIFCTWGMSDIKQLYKNVDDHQLKNNLLPTMCINLQPYVSKHLKLSKKQLLRLKHAVEILNIPTIHPFHDALNDAYYTAELFKKIYNPSIQAKQYDPTHIAIRPRQRKREIDIEKLILQFEKMYDRKISEEEQEIIKLAYKMGRTNQFLK